MPTDVREQLRQLTEAFDEFIDGTDGRSASSLAPAVGRARMRYVPPAAALILVAIACAALWGIVRRPGPSDGGATEVATTTTMAVVGAAEFPSSALDFATTDRPLPHFPTVSASDPPATTTGYGMNLCDSGPSTRVMRVESAAAPSHAYSGTLCVFVDLKSARPEATTSCATRSEGDTYARCQRRTDTSHEADLRGGSASVTRIERETTLASFPTATASNQFETFDAGLSFTTNPGRPIVFANGAITVTLASATTQPNVDQPGACFEIDIPSGVARGCVGRSLLATGLAYGAFQEGDGPVELIGIVPDSVTTIEIDGVTVTPIDNVWHYTLAAAEPATITVRAADGRAASTT